MFNLLPKNEKFFDDLDSLALSLSKAANQLGAAVNNFPNFTEQLTSIEAERANAREVYKSALLRLDKAFITPIDREDILNLITELYGVVDRIADLSQRFRLYRLTELHPDLTAQIRNLEALAVELTSIIREFRHEIKLDRVGSRFDAIAAIMERVKYDREEFLSSLYARDGNPLEVLKRKELHDLLEQAIERAEETAETLARAVLKNG